MCYIQRKNADGQRTFLSGASLIAPGVLLTTAHYFEELVFHSFSMIFICFKLSWKPDFIHFVFPLIYHYLIKIQLQQNLSFISLYLLDDGVKFHSQWYEQNFIKPYAIQRPSILGLKLLLFVAKTKHLKTLILQCMKSLVVTGILRKVWNLRDIKPEMSKILSYTQALTIKN